VLPGNSDLRNCAITLNAGARESSTMKAYSSDLRLRVVLDSDAGMGTKGVAEKYRVSEAWVRNLKRRRRETGSILPTQRTRGRCYRLFPTAQLPALEAMLREGALAHGWINELWTIDRVRKLIKVKFQIEVSQSTAWQILTRDLNWSSIKPQTILRERNENKINTWRETGFGRIWQRAQKRNAYLVFIDEAGFMLQPTLRKTFAPKGSRPVVRVSDPHGRISAACAIAVSPKQKRLKLLFRLLPDNHNFTGRSIAEFVAFVRRQLKRPMTVIWDSIPIHYAKPVVDYLHVKRDVRLEMIPEYAPELNPADGVWSYVKYGKLANFAPVSLDILRTHVARELSALSNKAKELKSFIAKCDLPLDDLQKVPSQRMISPF